MSIVYNEIYCESNILTLHRMDDNLLDLIITSPPYNINLGYNKNNSFSYDSYDDNLPYDIYLGNLKRLFQLVYEKTKIGGRCCINIGNSCNGRVPTQARIIRMMNEIGWLNFATIIWDKNNTSSRTAWGSYLSPSCPSFPTTFEFILIFSKLSLKIQTKGETDLRKEEFVTWTIPIWKFPGVSKKKNNHPASFPIELPTRLIKMLSYKEALVYDPFMGSGTTAVACMMNNRKYIGSEISENYCFEARRRLSELL